MKRTVNCSCNSFDCKMQRSANTGWPTLDLHTSFDCPVQCFTSSVRCSIFCSPSILEGLGEFQPRSSREGRGRRREDGRPPATFTAPGKDQGIAEPGSPCTRQRRNKQ